MTASTSEAVGLSYDLHGERGPWVVLLAGLGAQRHWWPPAFVHRLAQDHRVVLPDNRDVGRSPWLDHLGLAGVRLAQWQTGGPIEPLYRLQDMAADVVALLDDLAADAAHVVGFSMGGFIAQHVAFGWPRRVRSLTTMMSSSGDPTLPTGDPDVLAGLTAPAPTHSEDAYVDAATEGSRASANSALFDEDDARRRHRASFRSGLNPAGSGRQLLAAAADGDRTDRLRALDVPTLVVGGGRDVMLPVEASRSIAAAVPGARMVELDEVGHELPRPVHDRVLAELTTHIAAAEASS